ncbi:hypothetical protein DdX_11727 [Ditylenchus destructor]|uniref:Uncharacterized protein n=1 Tax=Ditylenchus destructor TaxID=166010 RepID=A0AAD4MZM0_9BILA|nr:hypothetical protein DdX_11727 [Ditylenchus destructor]
MSVLRCALQRGVLNARIMNGILRCLERQSTFNSFYISRLAHTSGKNGESGNTSRSAQNFYPEESTQDALDDDDVFSVFKNQEWSSIPREKRKDREATPQSDNSPLIKFEWQKINAMESILSILDSDDVKGVLGQACNTSLLEWKPSPRGKSIADKSLQDTDFFDIFSDDAVFDVISDEKPNRTRAGIGNRTVRRAGFFYKVEDNDHIDMIAAEKHSTVAN